MRKILYTIDVFLVILFFTACGNNNPIVSADMGTAVALTQTATVWTPVPTNTPDPDEPKIVEWLNESLTAADHLEQTFDVKFHAVDVIFLLGIHSEPITFRVDVQCTCANNTSSCCTPERTFVATMWAMKAHNEKISKQIPASVIEVQVLCLDHNTPIGMGVASWQDVTGYLFGQINGDQLGARSRTLYFP